MNWLLQKKLWFKYFIPLIIFITFLSCGIWLWTSYSSPWGYSYTNSEYTVTYTFYDRTYSWTQEYNNGTIRTGNGTYDIYAGSNWKYMLLTGQIHNASGTDVKSFTRTSAHSLTTLDSTGKPRLEEVTYTCKSALAFEIFCGLFISITGLYLIIQIYIYYRKASKNSQTKIQSNNSNNEENPNAD